MDEDYGVAPDRTCEICGEILFNVVPGRTMAGEIAKFALKAPGWNENPDALAGWMPPGLYCPNGHVNIHIDHATNDSLPTDQAVETIYGIFIDSAGPRRIEVTKLLRETGEISLEQAKASIDDPGICIATGGIRNIESLVAKLEKAGATLSVREYVSEQMISSHRAKGDQSGEAFPISILFFLLLIFAVVAGDHYYHHDNIVRETIANVVVLVSWTIVLSLFERWARQKKEGEYWPYTPPLPAIAASLIVGGVLSIFFGWVSTLALMALLTGLTVYFLIHD